MIQSRLDFLKTVRFGRYVLNNLLGGLHAKAYVGWDAYQCSDKSLETKYVIQRRLDFLKAVRFWRYLLNKLCGLALFAGLHSLGRILISSEILDNKVCDPASVGISEAR